MKNVINYYYNIVIDDIHHHDQQYYFQFNNYWYLLLPYYKSINELEYNYQILISNNLYCYDIIRNKNNEIITIINDIPYVLLKENIKNRKITSSDIIKSSIKVDSINKNNWKQKWCEKIDYYEYQMEQFEKKYPVLYESFAYYSGVTEVAISLLNFLNNDEIVQYTSHYRINNTSTLRDLYNPLEIIVDSRVRDIAEYFKHTYFYRYNPIDEVQEYIQNNYLSYNEIILFISRLIYPSYYFDIYDEIIKERETEDKIDLIINKLEDYEIFLSEVYNELCKNYSIPEINWLKKVVKQY